MITNKELRRLDVLGHMAEMTMPKKYQKKQKPNILQKIVSFARPGPKPIGKQITYRIQGSNFQAALLKMGEMRKGRLSFDDMELMRHHPIVKLGLIVRAAPVLAALKQARVECEDRNIAEFIKAVFVKEWLHKVGNTSIVPSYYYGVAPHEKIWETKPIRVVYTDEEGVEKTAYDGDALVYKKIKFVHPKTVEKMLIDPEDDFAGFQQFKRSGDKQERLVEPWKAFMLVNKYLYSGLWGEPETDDIYAYWYYSELLEALRADYLRFRTIPPIVGHAPVGITENTDGEEVDQVTYAGEILKSALENLIVVFPYEVDERGNQKWGFREMEFGNRGQEIFTRAIEELHVMILRGLIVPERTVTQNMAAVGSYNQAEIHAEMMLEFAKGELDRFIDACNTWLVPQLIEDNFGANAPACKIRVSALPESLLEKLYNVVITLLQNDKTGVLNTQVAFSEVLDILDIPWQKGIAFPEPIEENDDNNGDESSDDEDAEEEN